MAPALARRTPQSSRTEGRPKRQAALNRKETPGAPKKNESKEENADTAKDESNQVKKTSKKTEDSTTKDSKSPIKRSEASASKKGKAPKKNKTKLVAKRASPKKTILSRKKTTKQKKKTTVKKEYSGKKKTNNKTAPKGKKNETKYREEKEEKDEEEKEEEEEVTVEEEEEVKEVEEENPNEVKLIGEEKTVEDNTEEEDDNEKEDNGDDDEDSGSEPDDGELEDDDDDFDPDNDPDKLWCFCKKPHNNRFMICCDLCEEWFHGDCVGISMKKGREMEKTGEEWCCKLCKEKLQKAEESADKSPLKSPLNSPLVKKPAEDEIPGVKKKGRSLSLNSMKNNLAKLKDRKLSLPENKPQKEYDNNNDLVENKEKNKTEIMDNAAESPTKNSNQDIAENKQQLNQSFDEQHLKSEDKTPNKTKNDKTKGEKVIAEIPGFTFDHVPSVKKEDKTEEKNNQKRTSTDRRDSIGHDENDEVKRKRTESSSSKTKVRTTPAPKQVEPAKRCLREDCSRPVMKMSIYCSRECIYKYSIDAIKEIEQERKKNVIASPDPKTTSNGSTIISPATSSTDRVMETTQERIAVYEKASGKIVAGVMAPTKKYLFAWLEEHPTYEVLKQGKQAEIRHPKKDQDEVVRANVRKSLRDILINRCKETMMAINLEAVGTISKQIEMELLKLFGETGHKYKTKYRSLIFNLKDQQNKILYKRVVSGEITPFQLVHMPPEDLAAPELARWREQESKHLIEMIKKREQEAAELSKQVALKKTHKGEVEIEGDNVSMAHLEIRAEPVIERKSSTSTSSEVVKDLLKDTTEEHSHHLFDSNCKICTGKMAPPGESQVMGVSTTIIQAVPESSVPSPEDDSMILSSPLSPSSPDTSIPLSPSSPIPTVSPAPPPSARKQPSVWRGFVMMQKVAKFVCTAYAVSGSCENLMETLPDTIHVCGRIPPSQVWEYLSQMKEGRKNQNRFIDVIRFEMSTNEEKSGYIKLYSYFYTRERIGVVGNCYSGIKDMYILPLASHDPIPTELKPLPGLPKPRPHMLLGIIVRVKLMKQKLSDTTSIDSSPESIVPKKKKKKEKKLKGLEEECVDVDAQKKLLDIIFKTRVSTESVDVQPSTKEEVGPATVLETLNEIGNENQTDKMDVNFENLTDLHKKLEEEQMRKLREQQEEIERLKKEIGSSSEAIDQLKNDINNTKPTSDMEHGSKIFRIVDPGHILSNIQESISIPTPEAILQTIKVDISDLNISNDINRGINLSFETNQLLIKTSVDNNIDTTVTRSEVGQPTLSTVTETIPFMSGDDPVPIAPKTPSASSSSTTAATATTMEIPFMSKNDILASISEDKQVYPRTKKKSIDKEEAEISLPYDDDYVDSLIMDIKMPPQIPKFPLELIKEEKKKEHKMPELPVIKLPHPLELPLPGEIPKVPLPPNIKLPPGVPFPPLPPKPIPLKPLHVSVSSSLVPDTPQSPPDSMRGLDHVPSDPRRTSNALVVERNVRSWDERRENESEHYACSQYQHDRKISPASSSSSPVIAGHAHVPGNISVSTDVNRLHYSPDSRQSIDRLRPPSDGIRRPVPGNSRNFSSPPHNQHNNSVVPHRDLEEPRMLSWRHKEKNAPDQIHESSFHNRENVHDLPPHLNYPFDNHQMTPGKHPLAQERTNRLHDNISPVYDNRQRADRSVISPPLHARSPPSNQRFGTNTPAGPHMMDNQLQGYGPKFPQHPQPSGLSPRPPQRFGPGIYQQPTGHNAPAYHTDEPYFNRPERPHPLMSEAIDVREPEFRDGNRPPHSFADDVRYKGFYEREHWSDSRQPRYDDYDRNQYMDDKRSKHMSTYSKQRDREHFFNDDYRDHPKKDGNNKRHDYRDERGYRNQRNQRDDRREYEKR